MLLGVSRSSQRLGKSISSRFYRARWGWIHRTGTAPDSMTPPQNTFFKDKTINHQPELEY